MNRQGGMTDLFIFMIVAIIVVFISGIFIYFGGVATSEIHEKMDDMNIGGDKNVSQVIDDTIGKTLVAASSIDKELKEKIKTNTKKIEKSKLVGKLIAERAISKNIKSVSFDRNGYLFHGRVKALAEAVREGGLQF